MDIEKEDERLYLQFLQNNIARMNTNSAQTKGWCITIVAAVLAIFADTKNELFVLLCLVPVFLFCILDALYLQQEHKFVEMYNTYIKDKENKPDIYEMPMKSYAKGFMEFLKALSSWPVILVYGLLLVTIILSLFVIKPRMLDEEGKLKQIQVTETQSQIRIEEIVPVFKLAE